MAFLHTHDMLPLTFLRLRQYVKAQATPQTTAIMGIIIATATIPAVFALLLLYGEHFEYVEYTTHYVPLNTMVIELSFLL